MGKYRIETTNGTYEIETEDAPASVQGKKAESGPEYGLGAAAKAFWENTGQPIVDLMGSDLGVASRDPVRAQKAMDTVKGMVEGIRDIPKHSWEELSKSGQAMVDLKPSDAAYHLAGAVPLFGPAAQQVGDDVSSGHYAKGFGHAAALFAPLLGPEAWAKLRNVPETALRKAFPNVNNPVEEAALASVEKDVPMTVGQRTGNTGVQRVEQGLQNFPGSANRTQKFYSAQEEALANKGQSLANQVGGQATNEVGAGQALQQRLAQRINRLRSYADRQYDAVRKAAAANQQPVRIGLEESPLVAPNGTPIQTPVMTMGESPVSLEPIRKALAPVYEDLQASMPEARRAASPAFTALKNLMESDAPTMNAMDFDRSLSAIKSLARDGDNPYLTSKSQGIAKQIVANGEKELQSALSQAGPDVLSRLQDARRAVRAYHDTADLLADLNGEPAQLYANLTTGKDRAFNTLKALKQYAPSEMKTVARTYLQGLMDKATAEGGFGRAKGVMADWQKLGTEAKEAMYGKPLTQDLDNFFLAAKRLTGDANPSGSAHTIAALHGLGAVGTAVGGVLTGNLPVAAGAIGEAFVGPNLAARFLLNPENAKLLTKAISMQPGTPGFSKISAVLNTRYAALGQQQNQ